MTAKKDSPSDPTTDFARVLQLNNAAPDAPEEVGLPAIFPGTRGEIEERVHEETPGSLGAESPSLMNLSPEDFIAHYQRFDLADSTDIHELEKINNHIMRDGWLTAREEWVHTKDGGTFVVLKWLERTKPLKKKVSDKADADGASDILKEFGIGK